MKKTTCLAAFITTMMFALAAHAQPALQTLLTNNLAEPYGLAVDISNQHYITDSAHNRIAKFNPNSGQLTTFAGVSGVPGNDDGPGIFARFFNPQGIVAARNGLVVADSGNHRIRFVTYSGVVSTIAGSTPGLVNGAGTAAQFNSPAGLAADAAGNIYVADLLNNVVRKIDPANNVTTLASGFVRPTAVAVDGNGRIYVADTGTHSIRAIEADGTVVLVAGSGSQFVSGANDNLIASSARFNAPRGLLWVGGKTGLLIADTGNQAIRRLYQNPELNTFSVEHYLPKGGLVSPIGMARDDIGNISMVDLGRSSLLSIQVTAPQAPVSNPTIGYVVMSTNFFGNLVTELRPIVNSTFNNDVRVAILAEEGTETFYSLDLDATFPEDPSSRRTPALYANGLLEWTSTLIDPASDGSNVVIRSISTQDGRKPSEVVTARFQFKAANPVINGKNPGNFNLSVATEGAQLWYTTDGSLPVNGSPSRLYVPGARMNIVNGTNDIVFKVRAFKAGYTPSSEVTRTFLFSDLETSYIGLTRDFKAGIGSTIIIPVDVRLADGDQLRSLQFRVDVAPQNGAPGLTTALRNVPITTNDFVRLPVPSVTPPIVSTYQANTTSGIAITYIGTSDLVQSGDLQPGSGLSVQGSATVALIAVPIPPTATVGQTYRVSIVQPSGTSDGMQTAVPMNVFEDQLITVENTSYVVGDSAVGIWYNAGDFGNGNLNNNDVNNAFLASLGMFVPYAYTDVFDAMDAFPQDSVSSVGGDGQIRYLDWNLIHQRSLRLRQENWSRSWSSGGVRRAVGATLNSAANSPAELMMALPGAVWMRDAKLTSSQVENAKPGTTVRMPVYVSVQEGKTLAGLQFLAGITAADGAPALVGPVQFVLGAGIPASRSVTGLAANQVAYAWDLGVFNPPLSGRQLLGHVEFTVPETAQAGQCYKLRFANADGAPDLETQYEFESVASCVWVNSPALKPVPIISDEWKQKFFGTISDAVVDPHADDDGDGVPNWVEYLAGTNPLSAQSRLQLHAPEARGNKSLALKWLTAPGKQYVIESADAINGSWTVVASGLAGDGSLREFVDTAPAGEARYYRIRLQQ